MPWHEGAGPNILVTRILEKLAGSALEVPRFDSESCSLSEEPLARIVLRDDPHDAPLAVVVQPF